MYVLLYVTELITMQRAYNLDYKIAALIKGSLNDGKTEKGRMGKTKEEQSEEFSTWFINVDLQVLCKKFWVIHPLQNSTST